MPSVPKQNRRAASKREEVPARPTLEDPPSTSEARQDTGALHRGLLIIDAIVKAERPLTSAEIADLVSLSASTTHRLLGTLGELGWIFRDAAKRYYPSAQALFPANLFHPLNVFRRISVEQLVQLREQFGLASSCLVFLGGRRWVLETIHGYDALSPYNEMEVSAPIHATVAGKILLSTYSPQQVAEAMGAPPYQRYTPSTIVEHGPLQRELALIRERGHAEAIDEMLSGLGAVGAPIYSAPDRLLGAIVLAGPTKSVRLRAQQIAAAVMQATRLLSLASPGVRALGRFLGH